MNSRTDDGTGLKRRTLLTLAMMTPALAAGSASTAEAEPTSELPPDLALALNAYDQAAMSHDIATLAELLADDYLLVNSDTTLQDKQSYLADFTVPGFRLHPYVMQQPMHKVWAGAALTGGLFPLSWTQDDVRHDRLLRIVHVWAKHDGRWRITYTQLTRVPQ